MKKALTLAIFLSSCEPQTVRFDGEPYQRYELCASAALDAHIRCLGLAESLDIPSVPHCEKELLYAAATCGRLRNK